MDHFKVISVKCRPDISCKRGPYLEAGSVAKSTLNSSNNNTFFFLLFFGAMFDRPCRDKLFKLIKRLGG